MIFQKKNDDAFSAFQNYVKSLPGEPQETARIELDKNRELAYLKRHAYRYRAILKSLPRAAGAIKLLDIGTTPFTLFLKCIFPDFEVSTMDRTGLMEKRCQEGGVAFTLCDLEKSPLPFADEYFDVVIFTEVLEHLLASPARILAEVRRILHENGKLIVSVPNIATLYRRVKFLFGTAPLPNPMLQIGKDISWVHGHSHLHEYTMKEIAALLDLCGFAIASKRFLQSKSELSFSPFGMGNALALLVPAFRSTLYLECVASRGGRPSHS